jgi:predicted transcriptional regulator
LHTPCVRSFRLRSVAGDELLLTQEFLAQMMGVRRSTVTEVASELQKNGLISYARGRIHIKDIELIRERACECDGDIRSHYRRIFHSNEADVASIG